MIKCPESDVLIVGTGTVVVTVKTDFEDDKTSGRNGRPKLHAPATVKWNTAGGLYP